MALKRFFNEEKRTSAHMEWSYTSTQLPTSARDLLELLLKNRGIDHAQEFLQPKDPMHLTLQDVGIDEASMSAAVARILQAKEKKEYVVVYGDYDCDGVCATTILWETLFGLKINAMPFIPHRIQHGYGLSTASIEEICARKKPDLLITVDNGIVAHDQFQLLKDKGIDTILTDHHQPEQTLPNADTIVHTTQLCGTTVAWMLAKHLDHAHAAHLLDLCAIATIADQVPIIGASRSFTKFGLAQLNQTKRLGLQLLIQSAGLQKDLINTASVNYTIVPRINAMGRLGHALDAMRALCTHQYDKAVVLIDTLQSVNVSRQTLTQSLIQKARLRSLEWANESIIIIEDPEFHEGIVGLIASKLTEEFHKPTVVFSVGKETAKGSARSVIGVDITKLLRSVRHNIIEVGGHVMAAGLLIEVGKMDQFKLDLRRIAKDTIAPDMLIPRLLIDATLPTQLLNKKTITSLSLLEPYGVGNREPLFAFAPMQLLSACVVGKEGSHLKLLLIPDEHKPHEVITFIGFGMGKRLFELENAMQVVCAGKLEENVYRDVAKIQILGKDFTCIHTQHA